jgi:hypothetical protein
VNGNCSSICPKRDDISGTVATRFRLHETTGIWTPGRPPMHARTTGQPRWGAEAARGVLPPTLNRPRNELSLTCYLGKKIIIVAVDVNCSVL